MDDALAKLQALADKLWTEQQQAVLIIGGLVLLSLVALVVTRSMARSAWRGLAAELGWQFETGFRLKTMKMKGAYQGHELVFTNRAVETVRWEGSQKHIDNKTKTIAWVALDAPIPMESDVVKKIRRASIRGFIFGGGHFSAQGDKIFYNHKGVIMSRTRLKWAMNKLVEYATMAKTA